MLRKSRCTRCAHARDTFLVAARLGSYPGKVALFVSAFRSFWPLKDVTDCQTLNFSASFYKIRWGKNHSKLT
jgi:hypothetical protein